MNNAMTEENSQISTGDGAGAEALALARMAEGIEARACADFARAVPAAFGFAADESEHGVALFAATVDSLLFNRVLALGLRGPARAEHLAPWLARYRSLGVRRFGVAWCPHAQPASFPS